MIEPDDDDKTLDNFNKLKKGYVLPHLLLFLY